MLHRLAMTVLVVVLGGAASTAAAQAPSTTIAPAPPATAPPATTAGPTATTAPAPSAVTLMLTPSTGLIDGQTVVVTGTGYPANRPEVAIWVCPNGDVTSPAIDIVGSCGTPDIMQAHTDGAGNLEGTFVAQRVIEQQNRGFTQLDCGLDGCKAFAVMDNHLYFEVAVLITFSDVIPATPAFTG